VAAAVVVGILAAWAASAGAGAASRPESSLRSLTAQYRGGDRDIAIATVGMWTQAEAAEEAERLLEELRREAQDPPSKASAPEPVICGAAVLMSDAALVALRQADPRRARWYLASGSRLVRSLPGGVGLDAFTARFHTVAGLMLHFMGDLAAAYDVLSEGRRRAGDDADLLVALGAVVETAAALRTYAIPDARPTRLSRGSRDEPRFTIEGEEGAGGLLPRTKLADAQAAFRKALERQPDHLEARLRLGRVLLLRGKVRDALTELERVGRESPSPARGYLARMFEGRCRERLGDVPGAAAAYAAALDRAPGAEAGLLALGRVFDRLGEARRAQRAYDDALAPARDPDPWLDYQRGQPDRIEELLGVLRGLRP
jgi:tetratricopeptide (TPR) repeat protein